jgi:hypothetical protein
VIFKKDGWLTAFFVFSCLTINEQVLLLLLLMDA